MATENTTDPSASRNHAVAHQKRVLAQELKESGNPEDRELAKQQEIQAAQLSKEAESRANATGTKHPAANPVP